jgi:hypothetical protein
MAKLPPGRRSKRAGSAKTRSKRLTSEERRSFLRAWLGPWASKPRGEAAKLGLKLARSSVTVTDTGDLISPAAIAVIDVLGMSSMLSELPLLQIAREIANPFFDLDGEAYQFGRMQISPNQLRRLGFREGVRIGSAVISDTIVLARRPDWELGNAAIASANSIIELAKYVCKVTAVNALQKVWLRSAISFGECLISTAGRPIFLGKPIQEASLWERQQEWSGGMLTPSAVETLRVADREIRKLSEPGFVPHMPDWLIRYDIPLKRQARTHCPEPLIALNWNSMRAIQGHVFLKLTIPVDHNRNDVRRKFRNTKRFYNLVRKLEPLDPLPENLSVTFSPT